MTSLDCGRLLWTAPNLAVVHKYVACNEVLTSREMPNARLIMNCMKDSVQSMT